jgi:predicted O-methyltransferase YrrM
VIRRRSTAPAPAESLAEGAPAEAGFSVQLDYPVHPRARFGHGLPTHQSLKEILSQHDDTYRRRLEQIVTLRDDLLAIPVSDAEADPGDPRWKNGWIPGLDGASLYSILTHDDPRTYIEVGSGNSTLFARRAVRDHQLRTTIVSIDPQPRAEIDALCDEVVRSPLEEVDLSVFDRLEPGDVLFVDNSHRVFPNSDATVVFLEIFPRLKPGVLVQVHDIFLPDDYPNEWNDRFYSEQYVLAAFILGGERLVRPELPCWYVTHHAPELASLLKPIFDDPSMQGVERHGNSFWLEIAAG